MLLHGPNLNLLGEREPEIYGTATLTDYAKATVRFAAEHGLRIESHQSNHEGELIDLIHAARGRCVAIIINPGAFTHYAWAIHDALAAFDGPIVEVHISNPNAREAVAPHECHRPGRHRLDHGVRRRRLRLRRSCCRRAGSVSDLPAVGYPGRADRVRERFDEPALLVTNLTNVRWLTGFTGSNGWVAVLPDRLVLGTDGRYRDRAEAELADAGVDAEILTGFTRAEQHDQLIGTLRGIPQVGAEAATLTHAAWTSLAAEIDIVPSDGHIEAERRVKDAGEVARIAEAARIADVALAAVAPLLGDGPTEVDIRDELDHKMRRLGAAGPSYDTIVASGPDNAARPHHEPGTRRIVEGDTVVIDVGALVDGYHSDMTRSYVVGDPSAEQQEIYDLVLDGTARRIARRSARASPPATSTRCAATSSKMPATSTGTCTAPATASGCSSTRIRSTAARRPRNCWSGTW